MKLFLCGFRDSRQDSRPPSNDAKSGEDDPHIGKGFRAEREFFDGLLLPSSKTAPEFGGMEEIQPKIAPRSPSRDVGRLRLEGKEYIVADGDVAHFRFNT